MIAPVEGLVNMATDLRSGRHRRASSTGGKQMVLQRLATLAIAAPRRVLIFAGLLMVAAAIFGVPVAKACRRAGFKIPLRNLRARPSY